VFSNGGLATERDGYRAPLARRCAAAGLPEPYQFYLSRLDGAEGAQKFAEEIVTRFAPDDPAVKEIVRQFPKPADRVPELKKWLRAKLDRPKK
jgi:hypothetical protein